MYFSWSEMSRRGVLIVLGDKIFFRTQQFGGEVSNT